MDDRWERERQREGVGRRKERVRTGWKGEGRPEWVGSQRGRDRGMKEGKNG